MSRLASRHPATLWFAVDPFRVRMREGRPPQAAQRLVALRIPGAAPMAPAPRAGRLFPRGPAPAVRPAYGPAYGPAFGAWEDRAKSRKPSGRGRRRD